MLNTTKRIATIRALLEQGSVEALTYAALECRLTIEAICYERFRISNDFLPEADLKKWQPRDVIRQVIEDANPHAAEGVRLEISRNPISTKVPKTTADYEALEYVEIGTQSAIDLAKIGKLWHSLANVALHAPLSKGGKLDPCYGDKDLIKAQVVATVAELERIALGNLIMGDPGPTCEFKCECGTRIRRKAKLLHPGQTISCSRVECDETYRVEVKEEQIYFTRELIDFSCPTCAQTIYVPMKPIMKMKLGQHAGLTCVKCGGSSLMKWTLMLAKSDNRNGDQGKCD